MKSVFGRSINKGLNILRKNKNLIKEKRANVFLVNFVDMGREEGVY